MANVKISQLPVAGSMTDSSVIPVVVSGTTSQISGSNLKTYFGSYANSNVATFLASYGSNTITTTGIITAGNVKVFATNGNLVLGDATATNAPGLSSTSSITLASNRAGTVKQLTFGANGDLTLSGGNISTTGNVRAGQLNVTATDSYNSIQFSSDGTTDNGYMKVDAGNNMVISAVSNFYVKRGGSDRLAITNTTSDFMATTTATIQANKGGTTNTWSFYANGVLSAPGNITTSANFVGNTNGFALGYLNVPQVTASNTTLALSDAGKHYYTSTAANFTLTIPTNANVAFSTGTAISIVLNAAGNILVNAASGVTLYMAGNSVPANRVISGYGMATLMKVENDVWFINGAGVN